MGRIAFENKVHWFQWFDQLQINVNCIYNKIKILNLHLITEKLQLNLICCIEAVIINTEYSFIWFNFSSSLIVIFGPKRKTKEVSVKITVEVFKNYQSMQIQGGCSQNHRSLLRIITNQFFTRVFSYILSILLFVFFLYHQFREEFKSMFRIKKNFIKLYHWIRMILLLFSWNAHSLHH